jgi:uncharacterized membrane protein YcaP (DUF421 family)
MLFDSWFGLFRVLVVGILAYLALIICLRISGKRTLSKWNAFDFVITIALGSTLATVLLSKEVALIEGVLALALLVSFQFVITWLSTRVPAVQQLVKAEPDLLFSEGVFRHAVMKAQRVTESEIRAAVRGAGIAALEELEAVVLETDGSFSVVRRAESRLTSALEDVKETLSGS